MSEEYSRIISLLILPIIGGFFLYLIGLFLERRGVIGKKVFKYIYTPLTLFPAWMGTTYLIWPGSSVSFMVRILVSIVPLVLFVPYFYWIWQPLAKRIFPRYKKYLDENE